MSGFDGSVSTVSIHDDDDKKKLMEQLTEDGWMGHLTPGRHTGKTRAWAHLWPSRKSENCKNLACTCTQMKYAGFPKSVQFQRFDPCARVRSRTAGPYDYAGPTKGGWWSELETWRWGGWLSSPPDLWVLLIPSRLKAWLLLDMNASLIREIIFAACKLRGGATAPFSRRGSSSRLCRVINFHLREAVVLLQQERLSTSQQIPFKR